MKTKTLFFMGILLISAFSFPSCKKNDHKAPTDSTTEDGGYGKFTFTARGESVTCTASENQAAFVHDFHGTNYLTISGINRELPKNHEYQIGIDVALSGEIVTGTYTFTNAADFNECLDEGKNCDKICLGQILPNADTNNDTEAFNKSLQSTSGTMKITKVSVGKFENGFAEGKISGTFSFSGSEMGQFGQHPGTAKGEFENIPLLVSQSID